MPGQESATHGARESADVDVMIVGAGPVGLMLAFELGRAGVRAVVIDRNSEASTMPKGHGLVGVSASIIARRHLLRGVSGAHAFPVPRFPFGPLMLKLNPVRWRPLRVLPVTQRQLEQALGRRATEAGTDIRRGHLLVAFSDDGERVTSEILTADGAYVQSSKYLIGCDGARSSVRHLLDVPFSGHTSDEIARIGHVTISPGVLHRGRNGMALPDGRQLTDFLPFRTPAGSVSLSPARAFDREAAANEYVISVLEPRGNQDAAEEITLDELTASVRRILGVAIPFTSGQWLRRTVAHSRIAEQYRVGRVFLAGDAAHIFSAGGSSLNIGLMDAVSLASLLGPVVKGSRPPRALDRYHDERHAVGVEAIIQTRAQAALSAAGADADALRQVLGAAFATRDPHRYLARRLMGR